MTFKIIFVKEYSDSTHGIQRIALDSQIALQTNHFVDQIFRGFNWSPTEQLVKVC